MPTILELEKGLSLGEREVLPKKGVLRRGDEEVRPEPKVLLVLLVLAKRDGDLVTKNELIEEAWDGRAFGDEPIQCHGWVGRGDRRSWTGFRLAGTNGPGRAQ